MPHQIPLRAGAIRQLNSFELQTFVAALPAAAIHFDAEWDISYRSTLRARMLEAEKIIRDRVNFGEIDIDQNKELARSMGILNVPAVAYYRDGKLVAALVGVRQNIHARLHRLLNGAAIGYKDGTDQNP